MTSGRALLAATCIAATAAQAQVGSGSAAYPGRQVRILVGFAPGGGIDVTARVYAQRLAESLGQGFIVDNRPGAGGTIATEAVARAAPDGYTLLMVSVTHAINASLYAKLPYDSVKDFTPVSAVARQANCIAVHPSVPVQTLRDLIALARARPGELAYASAGNGTMMHVGMELFRSMAGLKMLHVPYNGAGPSTIAVMGGQIPVLSTSLPTALAHARAGKLRMLAVTTAQRTPLAPEYPTVVEAAGLAGYEAVLWIGLLAPPGTPAPVVNRLNAEIERLAQTREVREVLATQGTDVFRNSAPEFAELIRADVAKWGRIVRDTGAKVD